LPNNRNIQENEKKSFASNFSLEENLSKKKSQLRLNDTRSPLIIGYMWAINVTSAAIEMVVPIILGVWLDNKFHTKPLCILIGLFLGMLIMLLHLIKFANVKE
jgi:F0F1-type ATP synthase assembly protein I